MMLNCSPINKKRYVKGRMSPIKNVDACKSIVKGEKTKLRSINEVLKYNKKESPIKKKSKSRVKMIVRELEKKPTNISSKPRIMSSRKKTEKKEFLEDGALLHQPKIKAFFNEKKN